MRKQRNQPCLDSSRPARLLLDCMEQIALVAILSPILVFGRRAGLAAAQHAKRSSTPSIDNAQIEQAEKELLAPFSNYGSERPYEVQRDLQELMQNLVGIFRTDEDLKKALAELV